MSQIGEFGQRVLQPANQPTPLKHKPLPFLPVLSPFHHRSFTTSYQELTREYIGELSSQDVFAVGQTEGGTVRLEHHRNSTGYLSANLYPDSHKSILEYLHANHFIDAYNSLREETGIDFTPDPKSKYSGLLEKKWTSVIRLQKKVR